MSEQKIKLQSNEGSSANVSLSAPDGKAIIVQPAQRFEDRLANTVLDQVISNTSSVAFGVILCVAGGIVAAKWLGIPEAVKNFLDTQKATSDAIAKLAESVKDLVRDHEKSLEDIQELKEDVRDIKEDIVEMKFSVAKCPNTK